MPRYHTWGQNSLSGDKETLILGLISSCTIQTPCHKETEKECDAMFHKPQEFAAGV